ncbi:MAG: hypothetical protein R3293_25070 [Candidatus Promineifilaceae bacterium]|nr:hypothetical protein [Candidatus Promineifilaceae bacterium]
MSDSKESVHTFLQEFQATLAEEGSEAILRRINAERLLSLLAERLSEELKVSSVRFLPDKRMAGGVGADFLFQVDDYDLRLELLDAPDGRLELALNNLRGYRQILEENPNTVALILVWTADGLPAVPLSIARIRFLVDHKDLIGVLLEQAEPLEKVFTSLVQKQIKSWDLPLRPAEGIGQEVTDLREAFSSALAAEMETVTRRGYRIPARKAAAANYPRKKETEELLKTFDAAMNGEKEKELVRELMDI